MSSTDTKYKVMIITGAQAGGQSVSLPFSPNPSNPGVKTEYSGNSYSKFYINNSITNSKIREIPIVSLYSGRVEKFQQKLRYLPKM